MSKLIHYFASCIILSQVASWTLNDFCDELRRQNYDLSYDFHELFINWNSYFDKFDELL